MNKKDKAILIMLAIAALILLIAFYYGCRSGSEGATEAAKETSRMESQALTGSVDSADTARMLTEAPLVVR